MCKQRSQRIISFKKRFKSKAIKRLRIISYLGFFNLIAETVSSFLFLFNKQCLLDKMSLYFVPRFISLHFILEIE